MTGDRHMYERVLLGLLTDYIELCTSNKFEYGIARLYHHLAGAVDIDVNRRRSALIGNRYIKLQY